MKIKHVAFAMLLMFILPITCFAECSSWYLNEAKKVATNVKFSYYYYEENGQVKFNLIIDNLFYPIVLLDDATEERYVYTEDNNGEIVINGLSSGEHKYRIHSRYYDCMGNKLLVKTINLPYYNQYYSDPLCEDKRTLKVCKKWLDKPVSYEEFIAKVNSYEKPNIVETNEENVEEKTIFEILGEFYLKYYWIILGVIIIGLSILIITLKKKDRLV